MMDESFVINRLLYGDYYRIGSCFKTTKSPIISKEMNIVTGKYVEMEDERIKNRMKEVAEMLGVEIGEEFDIMIDEELSNCSPYRITERGLEDKFSCLSITSFNDLLSGKIQLVKRPWKPKDDEYYYMVDFDGTILKKIYESDMEDAIRIYFGNCFKTDLIALNAVPKMVAKMKEVLG